jgi:hypothetical protein
MFGAENKGIRSLPHHTSINYERSSCFISDMISISLLHETPVEKYEMMMKDDAFYALTLFHS